MRRRCSVRTSSSCRRDPGYMWSFNNKINIAATRTLQLLDSTGDACTSSCTVSAMTGAGLLRALEIAYAIKQEIRTTVGTTLRCSIGLARPNRPVGDGAAGEMQKPDGLMVLLRQNLPPSLYSLGPFPASLPGIGPLMEKRIRYAGIETMRVIYAKFPRDRMSAVAGRSVWGDRLWLWLLG